MLPPLPANPPPLRKISHEQAREGLVHLALVSSVTDRDFWELNLFFERIVVTFEAYQVAAELEDTLANRVPWYEERVRTLKELERLTERRVQNITEALHRSNFVRFYRLRAEFELLRLKAEVARKGERTSRALALKKGEEYLRENGYPLNVKKNDEPVLAKTYFTAFPDLKPPTYERKAITKPDGTPGFVVEEKDVLRFPRLPVLPDNSPALRKLRHEQVLEGFAYLQSGSVRFPFSDIPWPVLSLRYWTTAADACRTAAKLEPRLLDQVPWYEARVRAMKLGELAIENHVRIGAASPRYIHLFRFHRLHIEADLLRLKDELSKAGPATEPAPLREAVGFKILDETGSQKPRPHYTVFPELKPRTIERVEVEDPNGTTRLFRRDKDVVPLPALPRIEPHSPLALKVRIEQIQEGLQHLDRLRELALSGKFDQDCFIEYLHMATEVYRIAAELDDTPAKRVPWYEARIRTLKDIEKFIDTRVQLGNSPPLQINATRIKRLSAEAELLILKDEIEASARSANPIVLCSPCPSVCTRSRGLFPRLFHRR
jgi:hypothetical protein